MSPDPAKPISGARRAYDWLVIDGGGLAVTSWATHKDLLQPESRVKAAAYVFVTTMASLARLVKPDAKIVVAWDGEENRRFRRRYHPWYKHGRSSAIDRREVAVVIKMVTELLNVIGIATVAVHGREADDLVATITRRADGTALIFSDDKDYLQCVSERVHLARRSLNGVILSPEECAVMETVIGDEYLYVKSLMGDPGDNVKGLSGIGETKARQLIEIIPDILHQARLDPASIDWRPVPKTLRDAVARAGRKLLLPAPAAKSDLDSVMAVARARGIPYREHAFADEDCLQAAMVEAVQMMDLVTLDYEVELELEFPEPNLEAIVPTLAKMGMADEHDLPTSLYKLAGMSSKRQSPSRTSGVRSGMMEE